MITAATLLGLAWKAAIIAGLTLVLLRLARSRSAGERSMIAHAGLAALLALPAFASGLGAVRKLVESSMVVTGSIDIEPDGTCSRVDRDPGARPPGPTSGHRDRHRRR